MHAFVLLGVSGSRISTVGVHIAARLCWPYLEEDSFHSPANLKKMYGGIPLSEVDRAPALDGLSRAINHQSQPCIIVTCASLTRCLRQRLEAAVQRPTHFIYLRASAEGPARHKVLRHCNKSTDLVSVLDLSDSSIEIDAAGGIDVVTSRLLSRVRALAGMYRS